MATMKISDMAKSINKHCENYDYFGACGLIKETVDLWKSKDNLKLLDQVAQNIASHYLQEV